MTGTSAHTYGSVAPRGNSRARAIKLAIGGLLGVCLLYTLHTYVLRSEVKYGLMIDAGSTGSRLHTFTFRLSGAGKKMKLVGEDFFPVKPGLSAYVSDPEAAAKSLEPLMNRARQLIPSVEARAKTPVYVRATAGLRAVGIENSEKILDQVRKYLSESGFRFDGIPWASVLGGSDEGIYTWITVNYLMGRDNAHTVGILEMGGGSSQAAFVSSEKEGESEDNESCAVDTMPRNYEGGDVKLFAKSDLGFGLQKARSVALLSFEKNEKLSGNPCINPGGDKLTVTIPFTEDRTLVVSEGVGNYAACRSLIESIVIEPRLNGTCSKCSGGKVCGYDGILRPKPIDEYIAIAFYIERTVALGLSSPIKVQDIRKLGESVCSMSLDQVRQKFTDVPNGKPEDLCLDLAFIAEHLEHAHGITEESNTILHVKGKIDGYELGWSLGAMFDEMSKL